MRQFSKSKLIAFRQCPKRLWLEIHRPELRDDSGSQMVFRIGHEVGDVARKVYDPEGTGTVIDVGEIGYAEAFRRSTQTLKTGEGPLFEAGLSIDGALAFADVMLPVVSCGDLSWRMLEVKSTTAVKDYHRDDLAIQTHLATKMGVDIDSVGIAHIDNRFVYPGEGDYRGLFCEVDLTEETRFRGIEVEEWIEDAQATAALPSEPEIAMGPQCSDPFDCPFAAHCGRDRGEAEYPLSSLPRFSARRREAIESLGITDLREVPDDYLNAIQTRVRDVTITAETFLDATGAASDLAPHGLPATFLDFETVMLAIPIWKGTRPYQQVPFQFSLHRIGEDSALTHEAFLDLSGKDPSEPLARALLDHAGESGPVYVYNVGFERRVLRELGDRFPDLAPGLRGIIERLVDLLPIARARFYDPSQHGSWSLKAVLPGACPDLSYEFLDGVADGNLAVEAFREAITPETTEERRREIEAQLLAYCCLDTLAMVRLWEFFGGGGTSGVSSNSVAPVRGKQ